MSKFRVVIGVNLATLTAIGFVVFGQADEPPRRVSTSNRPDTVPSSPSTPPELEREKEETNSPLRPLKNRRWTPEETRLQRQKIRQRQAQADANLIHPRGSTRQGVFANGSLKGGWSPRGPFNQPGCWDQVEVVQSDDTVYGITCGHFGGTQFIFKGSLQGDDFRLISSRFPLRFDELFAVEHEGTRRLIVQVEEGGVAYTDDDGEQWQYASGLPDVIEDLIIQRSDDDTLYATDGKSIYRSSDAGGSFSQLSNLGEARPSRLYSPRYDNQPGHDRIFLARSNEVFELLPSGDTTLLGSFQATPSQTDFMLGGDERRLYVRVKDGFFSSTDGGSTWQLRNGTMSSGLSIATHPENPDIVIGGYVNPVLSWDGMATTQERDWWGQHQIGMASSLDEKHRVFIHADSQSTQFFYDSSGQPIVIHSTDGGLYLSYKEWQQDLTSSSFYPSNVFKNLTLLGVQTAEIYPSAMVTGARNPYDIVLGTQDQGTQTIEARHPGVQRYLQLPYGDGPHLASNDGETAWSYSYTAGSVSPPFSLYDANGDFTGAKQWDQAGNLPLNAPQAWYFHNSVVDLDAPSERLWILSTQLIKVEWKNGSLSAANYPLGTTEDYVGALAQSPIEPDRVTAFKQGRFYHSNNRGETWFEGAQANIDTEVVYHPSYLHWDRCGLWQSPSTLGTMLLLCPSKTKVYSLFSTDGGQSFEDVSGDLATPQVGGMVGDPDGRFVFASTDLGPLVFDVEQREWFDMASKEVPWFNGRTVEYIDSIDTVRFSTWGGGIWDFQINGCSAPIEIEASEATTIESAESVCPALCIEEGGEWNKHWWKDDDDGDSTPRCQCCLPEEPDDSGGGTDAGDPEDSGSDGSQEGGSDGETDGVEEGGFGDGGSGSEGGGQDDDDSGCGCSSAKGERGALTPVLLLLGALGLRRTRKKKNSYAH